MKTKTDLFVISNVEKIAPESLLFLYSPATSKHSAFPFTEISTSELPTILKKFLSKEVTLEAAILKL